MRTMKCLVAAGMVLLVTTSPGLAETYDSEVEPPVSVTFYHTTDLHEHGEQMPLIAGFVESRKDDDPNVLFVDSGDWFSAEGRIVGELAELETRGEAMAAMLGAMEYDALIPGSHEYKYGTPRLAELIDRFALPVVSANVVWPEGMAPEHAVPYRIFELDGVTVAIIGAVTPDKPPDWFSVEDDELLEVRPIEGSIEESVAMFDERADIIVLLTHLFTLEDIQLAQALPAVDIIFGGHDHVTSYDVFIAPGTDTIIQRSGFLGSQIGELTVGWDGGRMVEPEWRLVDVTDELPISDAVEEVHQEYLSQAQ